MRHTGDYLRAVQLADKFVREKDYQCLFPGCEKTAIKCHAIPRSACVEALASNGHLYTRSYSFNQSGRMTDIADPPEIIRTSVSKASVFKGYCATHDVKLFSPAEIPEHRRRGGIFTALQLRAYSVEYCRQRMAIDYMTRLLAVRPSLRESSLCTDTLEANRKRLKIFHDLYLYSVFNIYFGSKIDSTEYLMIPFSRNLEVSCCGVFHQARDAYDSVIAYNLISHSNCSYLILCVFKVMKKWLTAFLESYRGGGLWADVLNDIAFHYCEEPLISSRLWEAMSTKEQLDIRLALRHPGSRGEFRRPSVIQLVESDFPRDITNEIKSWFPGSVFDT